jgi:hypothetical protein
MKDIYVVVPVGSKVYTAADDFDRASMEMARWNETEQRHMEIVNVELLEEDD